MILTQTPHRISLFGGGTDYPAYYLGRGGMVVGFAIKKYCYLAVKRTPLGQHFKYRVVYSKVEDSGSISDVIHPGARGVLRYLRVDDPTEISYMGDLPSGGGMGASSAYVVGLLQALRVLQGQRHLMPAELAYDATYVERMVIGEAVGDQDQLFAAYGGIRSFEFMEGGGVMTKRLADMDSPLRRDLEATAVLVWTGKMRFAHEMAAKIIETIPAKMMLLTEMHQIAIKARDIIAEGGSVASLVPLLVETWELKRRLHPEITNSEIDAVYQHGLACGAAAGKLLGAGGGGFMLFLVPPLRRAEFIRRIGMPWTLIRIADEGCRVVIDEEDAA